MSEDKSKSYFPFQPGAPQPDSWAIEFTCPCCSEGLWLASSPEWGIEVLPKKDMPSEDEDED